MSITGEVSSPPPPPKKKKLINYFCPLPLQDIPLVFDVPVGQIEHSWPIVTLTVLATVVGCGLVLWNSAVIMACH